MNSTLRSLRPLNDLYGSNELNKPLTDHYNAGVLDNPRQSGNIKREVPVPTIKETLQEMSGAKVFSKLDLNMAFHQIELAPESRDITTFAGPNGLYRYKRLSFGVNLATEKFQHIIWQILKADPQGLPWNTQYS